MAEDFDAGFEKPQSNSWKPGKEGDVIKGVYLSTKEVEGKYGPVKVHELRGLAGKFHNIKEDETVDEAETEVVAGESYVAWGRSTFDDDIAKAKPGQQVILRFIEMRKPKSGGKPYKMVECKLGGMDPEYLKEQETAAEPKDAEFK